jgi:tetratricopeptide (TPR) repeat protein
LRCRRRQDRGGDLLAARETFAQAADAARRLDAPEQLARAALGYGGRFVWFRAGKDRRLVPLLEDALDALPDPGPLRARLLARLAGALRDHPVSERRASLTREAIQIARGLDDAATLAYALEGSYAALCWPRDTDAWLVMGRELTQLARETGDREHGFFGHLNAFGVFMARGDIDAADAEFATMTRLAHELRQPAQQWAVSVVDAMRALFAGRLDEAERLMDQAAEVGSGAQGLDATFYYVMNLQGWALRREQGRLAEIEAPLEGFVQDYPNFIFRSVLTSLYCEVGREDEARAELERLSTDHFPDLEVGTEWFFGASLLAEVCASLGAREPAAALYEALLPYADYNVYSHVEAARGSASRDLGLLAATLSRWEEATHHFEHALEMNTRMGASLWVAHTQHDYARAVTERGELGGRPARELLSSALAAYRELRMEHWAKRAEHELAGVQRPR